MVNNAVLAAGCAVVAMRRSGVRVRRRRLAGRQAARGAQEARSETKAAPARSTGRRRRSRSPKASTDLEKKSKRKRPDLQTRIEQAGLTIIKAAVHDRSSRPIAVGARRLDLRQVAEPAAGGSGRGDGWPSACPISSSRGCAQRRIKKFIDMLPTALDIIVRGVKAGLPLGDTLAHHRQRSARAGAARNFARSSRRKRSGFRCRKRARKWLSACRSTRDEFLCDRHRHSVEGGRQPLRGGRQLVARPCARRKKMKGKISAMSMEALASAVIIGAGAVHRHRRALRVSPGLHRLLWTTQHGRIIVVIAHVLDEHRRRDDEEDDQLRFLTGRAPCLDTVLRNLGDPHFLAFLLAALGCAATVLIGVRAVAADRQSLAPNQGGQLRARTHPPCASARS